MTDARSRPLPALALRRLDLRTRDATPSAARDRAVPARCRPGSRRAGRRPPDPRRRPRARRRGRARGLGALRRRSPRRAPAAEPRGAARRRGRARPRRARCARDRHRQRAPVRRGPGAGVDAHHDRPRRGARASLAARVARAACTPPAAPRRIPSSLVMGVVPARVAGVGSIVVASPADRDGQRPPRAARRRRPARRGRAARRGRRAGDRRARVRPRRTRASTPSTSSSGRAAPGSPPPRSRSSARSASTCPPARPRASSSPTRPRTCRTVAADLLTQAEHGADSPALLVTTDEALRRRRRGRGPAPPRDCPPARHPRPRPRRPRAHRPRRGHRRRHRLRQRLRPRAPVRRRRGPRGRRRAHPQRRLDLRRALVARSRRATTPRARTTSCPTGGLARACGPLAVETFGKFNQVQRITREGLATLRPAIRHPRGGRGAAGAPRRGRGALRGRRRDRRRSDEPQPVRRDARRRPRLVQLGGDGRGRRGALRHPRRRRSCGSTSTRRPRRPTLVATPAARGAVRDQPVGVPARRLPPARGGGRGGLRRHDRRDRPGRRRRRDPRHVHQGVPARRRGRRDLACPTYAMYRVHAEQRGGRGHRRPAPARRREGWAMDVPAVRAAAREATLVWICNPNNPTGLAEPDGAIERCSRASRPTRPPTAGPRPPSSWTRPTASSRATP